MARIGKKAVDLSDFDYNEPVIFKELTLGDVSKIFALLKMEKKKWDDGEVPESVTNIIILQRLIEKAPFKTDRESMDDMPLSLAVYLLEQAGDMLAPLAPKTQNASNTTTEEEKSQTQNQQN